MRSVSQASNLLTNALGSWLTIPLTLLVNSNANHPWIASDIDDGELGYYFYLLAGLMALALLLFSYLSAGYVYVDPEVLAALDDNIEEDPTTSLIPAQSSSRSGSRADREPSDDLLGRKYRVSSDAAM